MWRTLIPTLLLAGCAQLPPPPGDADAKRFESIRDKSVIYIVRQPVDSQEGRTLTLDNQAMITTWKKTYYRWEVAPGTHRIAGFGGATESLTLTTAPGRIYFVQHTVLADLQWMGARLAALKEIDDQSGRNLVSQGQLLQ